ncbi:MAG: hypothetical protein P1U41_02070 [Vicingaceae bacterium]|nr:hypothetical protein [Vicingaceae bacterium]
MIPKTEWFDILVSLFYLAVIYFIAFKVYKSKVQNNQSYQYFILSLSLKLVGGLVFFLISIYYYQRGDTFLYFEIAENLRGNLFEDFNNTISTFFSSYSELKNSGYNPLEQYGFYYERPTTWFFSRIVFLFNILGMGSYLATTILFSSISFIGLWLAYISITKIYPIVQKYLLVPFFLIPTALIWSSGILKDTIVVSLVCLLLFTMINILSLRKIIFWSGLICVFSVVLIYYLKPIIIMVLLPISLIWILPFITRKISNKQKRRLFNFLIFIVLIGLGIILNNFTTDVNSKYRISNLFNTLKGFQTFHTMDVFARGQNSYILGGVVENPIDIFYKVPSAINVTFFRPYFWEVNNLPMLLGALESFLLLLFVVYILFNTRKHLLKILLKDNFILFLITFSICFAIVVGVSSYNFGALTRYKITSIMLLLVGMIIILQANNSKKI